MGRRVLIPVAVTSAGLKKKCKCRCTQSTELNVFKRNPWAICHKLKGTKAYEKCVRAIKRQEGIR